MIITTTNDVPGRRIVRTLGLARGNTIRARNIDDDRSTRGADTLLRRSPSIVSVSSQSTHASVIETPYSSLSVIF